MKTDIRSLMFKLFPLFGLVVIMLVFTVVVGDRLWTRANLMSIANAMFPLCLGGAGMIFVASQGSTDMSQGSLLAFCGTIGGLASIRLGTWAFIPAALIVGAVVGAFSGSVLAFFKVPSVTVTLAMLIALRAVVSYLTSGSAIFLNPSILVLNKFGVKLAIVAAALIVMWYLFEYGKAGFFARCIGENQVAGQFSGIAVRKYKVLAFMLSGIMAGLVGVFTVASIGGVSSAMGNFFELQVMTAMFVGGIPVTGGANSKFYKLIVGSLMIAFLRNGLAISKTPSEIIGLIQGVILLSVVFLDIHFRRGMTARRALA